MERKIGGVSCFQGERQACGFPWRWGMSPENGQSTVEILLTEYRYCLFITRIDTPEPANAATQTALAETPA